jgi:hypothetical protein
MTTIEIHRGAKDPHVTYQFSLSGATSYVHLYPDKTGFVCSTALAYIAVWLPVKNLVELIAWMKKTAPEALIQIEVHYAN